MATVISGDCFTKKLVEDVQSTFKRLEIALKARETQILRQIDVILQQYALNKTGNPKCFKKINVVFTNEVDILKAVSNFGIIDFEGISFENNIYQIEDYENPNCDHICLHKCLKKVTNAPDVVPNEQETNEKVNESSSPIEKVSSDTIVKNLHSYASTLKSLQSNENLHALAKNMEIKISDNVKYTPDINENHSFEFQESSFTSDSRNSTDDLNDDSSTSKVMSDHSSFEFHESSIENTPKMQKECTKSFYNRHESRYAKISMSNLVESEDEFKECTPVIEYETKKPQFSSKNDLVNQEVNESNEIKSEIINENPSTPEVVASKMNIEYPIQQWMQQISREPELEPIQNNELMEHVNITTML